MFFESFLTVIVTKKAACENARTQVALDFEGVWIFSLPTLGGGRSILLSYGCIVWFSRLPAFCAERSCRLFIVCLQVVRIGSDISRSLSESVLANSEVFPSVSGRLTISIFHQMPFDGQYLRKRAPTDVQTLTLQAFPVRHAGPIFTCFFHVCQLN